VTYRILVVDDSTTIQKIFKIAFSRHDALVIAAGSMIEAVSEINRTRPDLLVMDASLPGTKRPTDLKNIQEDAGNAPVLLLVGSHDNFDEQGFRAVAMNHFLRKPFEAQDILRAVALVLGKEVPLKGGEAEEITKPVAARLSSGIGTAVPPPPPIQSGGLSMPGGDLPPLPNQRFEFADPDDLQVEVPLPTSSTKVNHNRRGRRAFGEEEVTKQTKLSFSDSQDYDDQDSHPSMGSHEPIEARPPRIDDDDADFRHEIRERLEDFIGAEAPVIVRRAIEAYCEKHFAEIARSVLTAELRRLADEKSRLLVDS
jgi:CheY-like chemotaxis protein